MPITTQTIPRLFVLGGGLSTERANISADISHVLRARNVYFDVNGAARKRGGQSRHVDTQLVGGSRVNALYDYFRHGTAGSSTEQYVIQAGTKFFAKTPSATTWTDKTGVTAPVDVPTGVFLTFNDDVIFVNGSQIPFSWDQQAATTFVPFPTGQLPSGVTTFNPSSMVYHEGRLWAIGVDEFPSRLYWSRFLDRNVWNFDPSVVTDLELGAGFMDIDPQDGDRGIGLVSYAGDLYVFKGPNFGSIHRIVGRSNSIFGIDPIHRVEPIIRNLPAVSPLGFAQFQNDVAFISRFGIHSLQRTQKFGAVEQAFLSADINTFFRERLMTGNLTVSWLIDYRKKRSLLAGFQETGQGSPNIILVYHYDLNRWSLWEVPSTVGATLYVSGVPEVFIGTNDGFVNRVDKDTVSGDFNDLGLAYTFEIETPFIFVDPNLAFTNTYTTVSLLHKPVSQTTYQVQATADNGYRTETVNATFSATGGVELGSFLLGTDSLGEPLLTVGKIPLDLFGVSMKVSVKNTELNKSIELHGIGFEYTPSGLGQVTNIRS